MNSRTKIIATLGPSCEDPKVLKEMIQAGMNIARLNASHGTFEQFKKMVTTLRSLELETGKRVGILLDLQGPKIRLGQLPAEGIIIQKGQTVTFSTAEETACIPIAGAAELPQFIKPKQRILIEDGMIQTEVKSIQGNRITALALNDGRLQSHKGVNLPDTNWDQKKALTDKDRADLEFGLKALKVDAVALSFVESAEGLKTVRQLIRKWTHSPVTLIAKIERPQAIQNLESILNASDAVMVARGDLAIETSLESVPIYQKQIVEMARARGKAVIVATQMLQSMVSAPLPTRAEVSDVAEAVFEMADAVMLSNETAVGQYPVVAIETLQKIAEKMEAHIFKEQELYPVPLPEKKSRTRMDQSMALNACRLADEMNAEALMVLTKHGYSAISVVKHRPKNRLIIVTHNEATARALNFYWGLHEIYVESGCNRSEEAVEALQKRGILRRDRDIIALKLSKRKCSLVIMSAER